MTLRLMILLATLLCPVSGLGSPTVDITTHGAIGDGKTLNTKALQAAVDHCAAQGGGTVLVPPGTFLTGTVELKSNITLSLSAGAVLLGSGKIEDYPPVPFRHNELGQVLSLLWSIGQTDLHITGRRALAEADSVTTRSRTDSPGSFDKRTRRKSVGPPSRGRVSDIAREFHDVY
jgi:polygalacturonase